MSDLLIKGVEMPRCCNNCAFHKQGGTIKSVKNGDIICKIIVKCEICKAEDPYMSYRDADTKRRDDCPLVMIPSHGRLIDADSLKDNINIYFFPVIGAAIDNAPTIIEEENSNDD